MTREGDGSCFLVGQLESSARNVMVLDIYLVPFLFFPQITCFDIRYS